MNAHAFPSNAAKCIAMSQNFTGQKSHLSPVGRTDLLAANFLCHSCLRGPRTLGAWICIKERCADVDP